jgi:hypothetical protein
MSAYIVDKVHIDVLVSLAIQGRTPSRLRWYHDDTSHEARWDNADDVGRMLWRENLASVAYRYPDDTSGKRPGPCDLADADIEAYTHAAHGYQLTPVEGLQAIRGYEYQACEHPGWHGSEAYAFCDALRRCLISRLRGSDDAPWEWTQATMDVRTGRGRTVES